MFGVIESHVKTAEGWKRFHLAALRIRMTDRTDLTSRISKLLLVTASARCMRVFPGERRLGRVVGTTMAKQTWQPRMIGIIMLELRVIRLRKDRGRANNRRQQHECDVQQLLHFAAL
jgi:hypothetical protein